MKTFRDTQGREWAISVDVNAIKRVMQSAFDYQGESIKVNLLALVDSDSRLLPNLVEYPPLVCDIAYAICKPQCDEKAVSDEDFGRAMGGDVLENVLDCLLQEIVDFFPSGRRQVFRKVLDKANTFSEKVKALTAARLLTGELDTAIDAILANELRKFQAPELPNPLQKPAPTTGTGSVGNLEASSALIPVQKPLPS